MRASICGQVLRVYETERDVHGDVLVVTDAHELADGRARKIRFVDPDGDGLDELVLCRLNGRFHALNTLCPHEGGRLAEGPLMEGRYAFCPLHLFKFDPVSGAAVGVDVSPARTYPVTDEGARVLIRIGDAARGS